MNIVFFLHYWASENSNTHLSAWASIHQHQCGPTTGDYRTIGNLAAKDMENDQIPNKWAQ